MHTQLEKVYVYKEKNILNAVEMQNDEMI